jgi:hypothetical protein
MKYEPNLNLNYPDWIASLPCLKCGVYGVQKCHLRRHTDGGTAKKPDDKWLLPICDTHHKEQHRIGEDAFYGGDSYQAKKLCEMLYLFQGQLYHTLQLIAEFRWRVFK